MSGLDPAAHRAEQRRPGDSQPPLSVTEALDQLTEGVASAHESVRQCLMECQLCRNHLLYLLDTPGTSRSNRLMLRARLRALPEVHPAHGQPGNPDASPPRIRGIADDAAREARHNAKRIAFRDLYGGDLNKQAADETRAPGQET